MRPSLFTRRRDERGAILVLSVVGVIVVLIGTALAVDLGRLAATKRQGQKVADLAALDAARNLATACDRAKISVNRNNYNPADLDCLDPANNPTKDVVIGKMVNGSFVQDPAGDVLKVEVTSAFKNMFPFVGGPDGVTVDAYASVRKDAGFSLGSALARIDATSQAPVLNRTLETLLGGSNGSLTLDAVSYKGISEASVTLGDIATKMGFGTVNELLVANVKVKDLINAMAQILSGNVVLAAQLNGIRDTTSNSKTVTLGDIIKIDQGVGNKAASGQVNVLQMIIASAEVANQSNFATGCMEVPNALNNALVGTTKNKIGSKLCLKVIEPPRIYFGPVGGSVTTSQVEVTFYPTIDVGLVGLPLGVGSLLKAVGELPVTVTAGKAVGTLAAVNCAAPQGITVSVDTDAVKTSTSGSVDLRLLTDVTNTGPLIAAGVTVKGDVTGPNQAATSLSFAYPTEFTPPADSKTTPGSAMSLSMNNSVSGGTVHVTIPLIIGSLTVDLPLSAVSSAVLTAVNPVTLTNNVLSQLQNLLLSDEYASLGMRVGIADVAALAQFFSPSACGNPTLIG